MPDRYAEIAFTDAVKAAQQAKGSRSAYARREARPDFNGRLGADEIAFVTSRDSFFLASVSQTGWPYVQFRGGPAGFLRALDEQTLGFADFRGNRQYITAGNLARDDRVSLFLIDYPQRLRLKLFGRARLVDARADPDLAARLTIASYPAVVDRLVVVRVEAFDWNCPQHITPRFTEEEIVTIFAGVGSGGARATNPASVALARISTPRQRSQP